MQVASDDCLAAIKNWEGCAKSNGFGLFVVYNDLNGYPTIGWGHKLTAQEIATNLYADGLNQQECDGLFLVDVVAPQTQVNALNLALTQGQFDALVSFDYNLGINALKTMLSHGLDQVPQQIPRWVHAAGVVEPGLVKRRNQEVAWWNS